MATSVPHLPELPPNFAAAQKLIDEGHAADPRTTKSSTKLPAKEAEGEEPELPYELHYARKMTRWLAVRCPDASPTLQLACRAQHFRRWEIPRDTFPPTRVGYLTWRAKQKSEAASRISDLLSSSPPPLSPSSASPDAIEKQSALVPAQDVARIASLIRKENLQTDEGTQVLEDVACLVFLDDQFDDFERRERAKTEEGKHSSGGNGDGDGDEKIVNILRKTWNKMSPRGREIALAMQLSERAKTLIGKALSA